MARKKKKKKDAELDEPPKLGGEARTSLRGLLADVEIAPPTKKDAAKKAAPKPKAPKPGAAKPEVRTTTAHDRPSDTLRGDDRIAYWDAYANVAPLRGKAAMPHTPSPRPASAPKVPDRSRHDDEARARLAALVAGGIRFDVEHRDDDRVHGVRVGTAPSIVRELARRDASPETKIDLHGMLAAEAEAEVVRFVRRAHKSGARRVLIVHGKGLHSEGGAGVLRDVVVRALTHGGAAPVVLAFASAAVELGGSGALVVELTR